MRYWEQPTPVPGVVLWQRDVGPQPESARILPDGCLDLIWDGRRVLVAGPDSMARWHHSPARMTYVGLRFSGGTGPNLLGLPADQVLDRAPELFEVWPSSEARTLTEKVAADPPAALQAWLVERASECEVAPLGPRVFGMAAAQIPVAAMADRLGLSARQLHRRCLPVFGYGPRRLARVLRLGRALDEARAGVPLAQVAADIGYADQAHLNREVRALVGTTPRRLLADPLPRAPGSDH